jgi:competence ComEA-like helix-hairpin-helix protein
MIFLIGSILGGCAKEEATVDGDTISLAWSEGETFYVGATYRLAASMSEDGTVGLDGSSTPSFGEAWSDEVAWTFQVVETGLVPEEDDDLYPYAQGPDGVVALDVVRAWVDGSLNDDPELLAADPVIYLVFRADRDRLAAVIEFVDTPDGRVERAVSTTSLSRSWSPLSQSMLTMAPTLLAPWSARYDDRETTLENGSILTTERVSDDSVDAFYDDAVGGGMIVSRYERGAPWPTWTVGDNIEARLLDADEVKRRAVSSRALYASPKGNAPEDFDYRAALRATVDIEAALNVDAETMSGGFEAESYRGYQPWAGSWWPLKKAGLVFGYDDRDTISDRVKDEVDPLKKDMDALSEEIRKLSSGSEKDEKTAEYEKKQEELVKVLVTFYDTLLQDLDGGRVTIADGKVSHSADGWSYDLDELSPMDKFALHEWADGDTSNNPFYLPAWELLNMYNPSGGSWWGHCNGWSAAAILTNEPTDDVKATIKGESVKFTTADQKGLLTESHYSTYSTFYGQRYNGESDDIKDLTPAAFHRLITFYVKQQGVPLVFDTSANEEVWNFPAWKVELVSEETTSGGTSDKVNINTADAAALDGLPGIGESLAAAIIAYREANGPFQSTEAIKDVDGIGDATYDDLAGLITVDVTDGKRTFDVVATVTLATDGVDETHVDSGSPDSITETWSYSITTDAAGLLIDGTWEDEKSHPDFAWVPYENPTTSSSGSSENPFLDYGELLEVLGDDVARK